MGSWQPTCSVLILKWGPSLFSHSLSRMAGVYVCVCVRESCVTSAWGLEDSSYDSPRARPPLPTPPRPSWTLPLALLPPRMPQLFEAPTRARPALATVLGGFSFIQGPRDSGSQPKVTELVMPTADLNLVRGGGRQLMPHAGFDLIEHPSPNLQFRQGPSHRADRRISGTLHTNPGEALPP